MARFPKAMVGSSTGQGGSKTEALGPFRALDPQAQDVARAVGEHAKRQIDGPIAHDRVLADLDAQRVEEDHRVHRLERPRLPSADLAMTASDTELMNSGEASTA